MGNFQNNIAIITGASHPSDIGTAICRKLAADGVNIFFTHWHANPEWIDEFKNEILSMGVSSEEMTIDLSDRQAAKTILHTVVEKLGIPSILVNNAAHSTQDGYLLLDAQTLDEHYAVNMRSTFLLCVEFARLFQNSNLQSGRIINMTSGQDLGPMVGELAYVSTKGAISAFTRSLAQELAPFDITVNAVNPGPTDSTWMNDEIRNYLLPKFPMGRIGTPDDVARMISFLASDEAKWITGQILHSEGGFLRG
ncbi:SDR family oxidoreductase [Lysinibacillus cavernae]|uniref:SDR family oxidoreductase n=1 Tax=Lysinibacillus cavernae TaxID=2666135 RepID=UPI0012D899DF|nr:SDR family oxidoreductase [Lysinibacillus cavernae]